MSVTFEYEGKPIKNVPFWRFCKVAEESGGLIVQFQNSGSNKYGPYALFLVDGDFDGQKPREYWLKPSDSEGNALPGWDECLAKIEANKNRFVLARGFEGADGRIGIDIEDTDGQPAPTPSAPSLPAAAGKALDLGSAPGDAAGLLLDRWLSVAALVEARSDDLPKWTEKQALTTHIVLGL